MKTARKEKETQKQKETRLWFEQAPIAEVESWMYIYPKISKTSAGYNTDLKWKLALERIRDEKLKKILK